MLTHVSVVEKHLIQKGSVQEGQPLLRSGGWHMVNSFFRDHLNDAEPLSLPSRHEFKACRQTDITLVAGR